MDIFEKCWQPHKARDAEAAGIYPFYIPMQSASGPEVIIEGRKVLMLGSNNYLGLTQHPHVIEGAIKAIEKYGTGCTGSRCLNGTLDLHLELERRLADWIGKESALVFTTGYQSNLSVISALAGRHDVIICDRTDHASIVDATRLSFARTLKFRHNDMEDLERVLRSIPDDQGKLIVVDGVFSMEGDIARLPEIVRLKKQYGARLIVDDAHSVGVLGKYGRGTASHFGLDDEVDLIVGTFSKSFATAGGFVAGDADIIWYIKQTARPFIFTAAIPPASAGTALAALDIFIQEPERQERLARNARKMKAELTALGFDTGDSETPIIPIIVGEEVKLALFWRQLLNIGLYANTAVRPAVEPGRDLLRTSYMATHTDEHLDRALAIFEQVGAAFGLIPAKVS